MQRLIDADALEKAINEWMPKDQEAWMDGEMTILKKLMWFVRMYAKGYRLTKLKLPTIAKTGENGNYFIFEQRWKNERIHC